MAQDEPPPLSAAIESCTTSPLPAQRVVSFLGSMPAIASAERMQLRFDLERRRRGDQWRRLRGVPGFGAWERSEPDRAGFVFHKRVDGLEVPASYRAVVRFRWVSAGGDVVKRARRRTGACAQPDLRPNLVPGVLTGVLDARPGLAVYKLVVRNSGRTAAGPFSVRVGSGTAEVRGLPAQGERTVVVVAPICLAGTTTLALVDADRRVDESHERGNGAPRRCPLWGG
ncbi:MAG TPA: hypothetical protein VMY78_02300 [Solirubrobacteraceae bacterium]|nr:hypothetical protein [Solirubrobacteraceae bacterium]